MNERDIQLAIYNPESDFISKLLPEPQMIKGDNLVGSLWGVEIYTSNHMPKDEMRFMQGDDVIAIIKYDRENEKWYFYNSK